MTLYDFLTAQPWLIYVFIGLSVLIFLILLFILFYGDREIKFGSVSIGPKGQRKVIRSKDGIEISDRKLINIRSGLPEQSIYSLAFRSYIHAELIALFLEISGPFAGISYPGKTFYKKFDIEQLVSRLPQLIDASNPRKLENAIIEYFNITEPNIYGLQLNKDEFQVSLRTALFVINRLEKIKKLIKIRQKEEKDFMAYTEKDIEKI